MKSLLTTILALLFTISGLYAQNGTYVLMDNSTMTIDGTSTIHDWECDVQELQADINLDTTALEAEAKQNPVKNFSLSVPVKSIESGKGGMNRKIYGALEEEKHPNIMFELTNAEMVNSTDEAADSSESFKLMATGKLTIAGTTNEVSFPVDATIENGNVFKFSGNYELNMKDYKVDPPSAVFGTIKSGEMVTISFEVYFSEKNI